MRIGKNNCGQFLTDTPRCSSLNCVDFTHDLTGQGIVDLCMSCWNLKELVELVFICDLPSPKKWGLFPGGNWLHVHTVKCNMLVVHSVLMGSWKLEFIYLQYFFPLYSMEYAFWKLHYHRNIVLKFWYFWFSGSRGYQEVSPLWCDERCWPPRCWSSSL